MCSMSHDPFETLRAIVSQRYREEGPPSYIEKFLNGDFLDESGKLAEPMKTALTLIVLGYRPVTSLCILVTLVEEGNKPLSGRQLGLRLEKRLGLEDGRLTKGRWFEDRISRLLKVMCKLGILTHEENLNSTRARGEGFCIEKSVFPIIEKRMKSFMNGASLLPWAEEMNGVMAKEPCTVTQCSKCKSMTTSLAARYCENCGSPLTISCKKCGKEAFLRWNYCNHCGAPLRHASDAGLKPKLATEGKR